MNKHHTRLAGLAFAAALLALAACSSDEHAADARQSQASAPREVKAELATARMVELPVIMPLAGTLEAVDTVQLASRVMGRIRELTVVQGQTVKRGELLFVIDPVDTQGAVDLAKQSLVQAEAALKDARLDYERFKNLYKDDAVNKQQLEKMRMNYEVGQSRVAQAKAGLAVAQGQISYTRVSAPMDAVVTAKLANEGDMATPGHPLLTLEDVSRLRVRTAVPEAIFRELKPGDAVQVEVDGQARPIPATVARMTPNADPQAHTYPVTLDIAAPGLKSGAFARVLFPRGVRQGLLIPRAAVLERAGIRGVFVVDAQGLARYRMVRIGAEQPGGMVEALAGLTAGERVVVAARDAVIRNGDRIAD